MRSSVFGHLCQVTESKYQHLRHRKLEQCRNVLRRCVTFNTIQIKFERNNGFVDILQAISVAVDVSIYQDILTREV